MKTFLIILLILLPSALSPRVVSIPYVMGEMVETPEYVEYWKARLYHGDYDSWYDKGKWWFERNGHKIEYRRK